VSQILGGSLLPYFLQPRLLPAPLFKHRVCWRSSVAAMACAFWTAERTSPRRACSPMILAKKRYPEIDLGKFEGINAYCSISPSGRYIYCFQRFEDGTEVAYIFSVDGVQVQRWNEHHRPGAPGRLDSILLRNVADDPWSQPVRKWQRHFFPATDSDRIFRIVGAQFWHLETRRQPVIPK
jgi:hypothetical protein